MLTLTDTSSSINLGWSVQAHVITVLSIHYVFRRTVRITCAYNIMLNSWLVMNSTSCTTVASSSPGQLHILSTRILDNVLVYNLLYNISRPCFLMKLHVYVMLYAFLLVDYNYIIFLITVSKDYKGCLVFMMLNFHSITTLVILVFSHFQSYVFWYRSHGCRHAVIVSLNNVLSFAVILGLCLPQFCERAEICILTWGLLKCNWHRQFILGKTP